MSIAREDRNVWLIIGVMIVIMVLAVPTSAALLHVTFDYTLAIVAIGGALLGTISGMLGSFAVLRQQSLLGDTLSHAALPGVALAFLIAGKSLAVLLIGAGIAGWLGVLFIAAVTDTTRIKQDTAMGIALAAFFALGIALLSYIQGRGDASQAGLDKFIFGQAAAIKRVDIWLMGVVGVIALTIMILFWKEFKLITFNREFAEANGYPVRWLDGLLSLLTVVAIVLGLQLAGVILMVGLLIAPGVAARQWTQKLGQMVVLAGVFGSFAGATGAIASAVDVGLPTGPLIIVVASIVVAISLLLAPQRGTVWVWMQQRADRRRFAATHILRDIYSHARQHHNVHEPMKTQTLVSVRGDVARIGLQELAGEGLIVRTNGSWYLTDKGLQAAVRDARNQELWQLYRRHNDALKLPTVPENRDRFIEDVLPGEAVRRLEALLEGATS